MTVRLADVVDLVKVRRADGDGRETTMMGGLGIAPSTKKTLPDGDDGDEGLPLRRQDVPEVALSGWPIGSRSAMDSIPGRAVRLWRWCRRHRHGSVVAAVGASSVEVSIVLNLTEKILRNRGAPSSITA